jgi:hypothetical protein
VKYARRLELPPEPDNINNFVLPQEFRETLNGKIFCRDIRIEDRILIFITDANVVYLRNANIWIMDGTFKTVPTIFKQLYTIHALILGTDANEVSPLVYTLMASKSQKIYTRLFEELSEIANGLNYDPQPDFILRF